MGGYRPAVRGTPRRSEQEQVHEPETVQTCQLTPDKLEDMFTLANQKESHICTGAAVQPQVSSLVYSDAF